MTRDEARQILAACRLNTADQTDPQFAEALEMAMSDPELNQWLNEQQNFHNNIREELRAVRPPADLKARLLKIPGGTSSASPTLKPAFWQQRQTWAIAASIAILLSTLSFWLIRPPSEARSLGNFSSRMVAFALRSYQMDIVTPDRAAVRTYLEKSGAPADFPLNPALEKIPVKGGGRLTWRNNPVAMMCFELPQKETAFMFVIDEKSVHNANLPATARVMAGEDLHTALWRKDGKIYLLAAPGKVETVAALAGP